jgi:hypothetical protein
MRKANVSTTFDETSAQIVNWNLKGSIEKSGIVIRMSTRSKPGEIITLKHNWQYVDSDIVSLKFAVIKKELVN